ncbi:hypothetical protein ACN28S_17385 [Cystobacter fuscus]
MGRLADRPPREPDADFVGALAATEWGNFPVPVLGAGAGHVLGWYSALGILRYSMTPPTR